MSRLLHGLLFTAASTLMTVLAAAPPATGKSITLVGHLVCAKCTLNEDTGCRHALIVEEGTKEIIYYVEDRGGREQYHRKICDSGNKEKVKVTGQLVEKKDKKLLLNPKVEFVK